MPERPKMDEHKLGRLMWAFNLLAVAVVIVVILSILDAKRLNKLEERVTALEAKDG